MAKKVKAKPNPTKKGDVWFKKGNTIYLYHSHGVKKVVDKKGELIGYYGHSHRGGSTFKIGDKLFDPKWKGKLSEKEVENLVFQKRGSITIKTEADMIKAARNLSKDLS